MPNPVPQPGFPPVEPPDISGIRIDDGEPVDGIYAEKQHRLLTEPLYASWKGPTGEDGERRSFVAMSNVGLFSSPHEPPLVPDVLLSLDIRVDPRFMEEKRHRTYFIWEMGKPPEVVIEVVSNREGDELGKRKRGYARMRVAYYVVWDPMRMLSDRELVAFELKGELYIEMETVRFPSIGLALEPWDGHYENTEGRWLRWSEGDSPIPTGAEGTEAERKRAEAERERAEAEGARAEAERARAEAERARAERFAALLAQHGIAADEEPSG